jgi:hypothetical protein
VAESASTFLASWSSFYVMTGSSAAALTGLMFVVITLVMGMERRRRSEAGITMFSTPTVVHFGAALFVSATLAAPWERLAYVDVLIGLAGFCGIVYVLRLAHRTRSLHIYVPDLEDWVWYDVLPLIAYGAIFVGAIALAAVPRLALFAIAGGTLFLIFIGIRNSWDIVTFLALGLADQDQAPDRSDSVPLDDDRA